MIRLIKQFLNIEGIKLSFELDNKLVLSDTKFKGNLLIQSSRLQHIKEVQLQLCEIYQRGRGETRRSDKLIMGHVHLPNALVLEPNRIYKINFQLAYKSYFSPVENFGRKNFIFKTIATGIQKLNRVNSHYFLEAKISAAGVAIAPRAEISLFPV